MPPRPTTERSLPAGLFVHQACVVISTVGQLVLLLRQLWDAPLASSAVAVLAASSLAQLAATAVLLRWPLLYWRNRSWVVPLLRIALLSLPSVRRADVGLGRMLDHGAHPRLRGALTDWSRIILGIRLASSAVVALVLPQRPIVTLATQAVLALCISNSPVYCKCKLLSEPLTQQRMLALASGLEYATLPLMALAPSGGLLSTGAAQALQGAKDAGALCCAMLYLLNASIGLLLPTLVSCNYRCPSEEAMLRGSRAGGQQPPHSRWARLAQRGADMAAAADRWLILLSGSRRGRMWQLFVVWYAIAICWWSCRMAAGIL